MGTRWRPLFCALVLLVCTLAAQAADKAHSTGTGAEGDSLEDGSALATSQRVLLQAPTTTQTPPSNPNQYFLPSATPDPRLPVAGNSAFVDALETQTRRDSVDVLLRAALSPAADPLLAAFARTPATANLLAAFIGQGTPLLGLLDNVGAPVIDNIFGLIVDTPANLALVEAIATSPAFLAINSAQAGVSQILGPFERALLRYQTYLGLTAGGVPAAEAAVQADNAVNSNQGLSEGLIPPATPVITLPPILNPLPTPSSTPAATPVLTVPAAVNTPVISTTPVPTLPNPLPMLPPLTPATTPAPTPAATTSSTPAATPTGGDLSGVSTMTSPSPDQAAAPANDSPAAQVAADNQTPDIPTAYPSARRSGRKISQATAVEASITKDAVDNMYRDAFSPLLDPIISYLYRTPAIAAALKPIIGVNSLLSAALNQQGVPVVQATSDFLTGNPVTSFVIDYLAADPGVQAVIAAMKSAAETAGSAELAFLRTQTNLGALAEGKSVSEAAQIADSAVTNVQGLSAGATSGRRHLLQLSAFLPSDKNDGELPTKDNSPFVAAAESAIERDPVDIMIRDALSPVVDPFIAYLYRTPATAQILKPLIGINTPLGQFLDTVGTPIVEAISSFLLSNPLTAAGIQMIADDPNVIEILGAIKRVTRVIAPVEIVALRGLTYLGAVANGKSTDEATYIANSAIATLEGLSGRRHLLQANPVSAMLPSQTPNPNLPTPQNNAALAGLERIVQQDPFDQALAAALSPVFDPVLTYISRTPALSNALVTLAGRDTPLVQTLTSAATPIIQGFEDRVLSQQGAIAALQAITDSPFVSDFLGNAGNMTATLAPLLRTVTRVGTYLGALAGGSNANQALQAADSVFGDVTRDITGTGRRHLLQVPSLQSQVAELSQVAQFLPSQTPNPKLPTPENNAALAGLQSIVMNDSFDQRLAAVLAPALEPVLTYISRTPALSGAISNVFNNDSPLVKQLSAAALPLIAVFNATVINNPAVSGALDRAASSPIVDGLVERLQNLTSQGAPVVQTFLRIGTYLGNIANGLPAQQALNFAANLPGDTSGSSGRRLQQATGEQNIQALVAQLISGMTGAPQSAPQGGLPPLPGFPVATAESPTLEEPLSVTVGLPPLPSIMVATAGGPALAEGPLPLAGGLLSALSLPPFAAPGGLLPAGADLAPTSAAPSISLPQPAFPLAAAPGPAVGNLPQAGVLQQLVADASNGAAAALTAGPNQASANRAVQAVLSQLPALPPLPVAGAATGPGGVVDGAVTAALTAAQQAALLPALPPLPVTGASSNLGSILNNAVTAAQQAVQLPVLPAPVPLPSMQALAPASAIGFPASAPGLALALPQVQQGLANVGQAFNLPATAEIVQTAVRNAAQDTQGALGSTGQALAQGDFGRALNITQQAFQEMQALLNETAVQVNTSVSIGLPQVNETIGLVLGFQPLAALLSQNNVLSQDLSGLLNIILTDASNLAQSIPDPLAQLEKQLSFGISTPLTKFVDKLQNASVPATLSDAEAEVEDILSAFCTASSFTPSSDEPAACVGETLALELVPWTCAVDDSKDTLTDKSGSILTCLPAYLQLTRTPASCNWKYTAAAEWDGKECKLETTLFGTDGSATYGGTPILKEVKELVSNTVSNVTAAVTKDLKQWQGNALVPPTMQDLASSFQAGIQLASGPSVSSTLSGTGSIVADLSTIGSLATGVAGFWQQLGSLWG